MKWVQFKPIFSSLICLEGFLNHAHWSTDAGFEQLFHGIMIYVAHNLGTCVLWHKVTFCTTELIFHGYIKSVILERAGGRAYFLFAKKAALGSNINYKTRLTRTKPITPSCPFAFGTAWEGGGWGGAIGACFIPPQLRPKSKMFSSAE